MENSSIYGFKKVIRSRIKIFFSSKRLQKIVMYNNLNKYDKFLFSAGTILIIFLNSHVLLYFEVKSCTKDLLNVFI